MNVSRLILGLLVACARARRVGVRRRRRRRPDGRRGRRRRHRDLRGGARGAGRSARRRATRRTKQEFPKVGTPEYQSVQTQYVAYLVQRERVRAGGRGARRRGHRRGRRQAEARSSSRAASTAKRAEYEKALKEQGYTDEPFRETPPRTRSSRQKIFDAVTKDVEGRPTRRSSTYYTAEPGPVRHARVARGPAHPHLGEEQGRPRRLREEQGRGRRDLRAAARAAPTSPRSQSRTRTTPAAPRTPAASSRSRAARPCPSSTRRPSSWTRASSPSR